MNRTLMASLSLPRRRLKRLALLALSVMFVVAGLAHFIMPEGFVQAVPPVLPAALALVYISGLFEILGGLGVLVPATRSAAGWGLIALLIAVFPANVYMALRPELFFDGAVPAWAFWARLPLQAVLIAWAWWATRPDER